MLILVYREQRKQSAIRIRWFSPFIHFLFLLAGNILVILPKNDPEEINV